MEVSVITKEILTHFIEEKNSSDLHIKYGIHPLKRIEGELKEFFIDSLKDGTGKMMDKEIEEFIFDLFKLKYSESLEIAKEKYNNFKNGGHQEDFAIDILDSEYRSRINVYKSMGKMNAALRKIPNEMPDFESLGFLREHVELMDNYLSYKEGLILITGQTGSGKSTTLASFINRINKNQKKHIITIEDPVEFRHSNIKSVVTHREIGKDNDVVTFADGIRAALREDPDIILIGEMRDAETALAAIQAAQTGHLVLATLHTNSASETLGRIIDLFPPEKSDTVRVSLAQALRVIISQKLPKGLDKKRILSYEFMYVIPEIIQSLMKEKENFKNAIEDKMESNTKLGMVTMSRYLANQVNNGKISKIEGEAFANDKEKFKRLLK